jgi:hypothetical protein
MISTDKEFEVFGNIIKRFGRGRLQDLVNMKKHLEYEGYSIDEAEAFIDWEANHVDRKLKKRRDDFERIAQPIYQEALSKCPKCPECGGIVAPAAIMQKEGVGNIHGYKTVWQCSNPKCIYEEYSKVAKGDIMASLVGKEKTKILGKKNRMIKMSGE